MLLTRRYSFTELKLERGTLMSTGSSVETGSSQKSSWDQTEDRESTGWSGEPAMKMLKCTEQNDHIFNNLTAACPHIDPVSMNTSQQLTTPQVACETKLFAMIKIQ